MLFLRSRSWLGRVSLSHMHGGGLLLRSCADLLPWTRPTHDSRSDRHSRAPSQWLCIQARLIWLGDGKSSWLRVRQDRCHNKHGPTWFCKVTQRIDCLLLFSHTQVHHRGAWRSSGADLGGTHQTTSVHAYRVRLSVPLHTAKHLPPRNQDRPWFVKHLL